METKKQMCEVAMQVLKNEHNGFLRQESQPGDALVASKLISEVRYAKGRKGVGKAYQGEFAVPFLQRFSLIFQNNVDASIGASVVSTSLLQSSYHFSKSVVYSLMNKRCFMRTTSGF